MQRERERLCEFLKQKIQQEQQQQLEEFLGLWPSAADNKNRPF